MYLSEDEHAALAAAAGGHAEQVAAEHRSLRRRRLRRRTWRASHLAEVEFASVAGRRPRSVRPPSATPRSRPTGASPAASSCVRAARRCARGRREYGIELASAVMTAVAIAATTSTAVMAMTPRWPRSLPGKSGLRRPDEAQDHRPHGERAATDVERGLGGLGLLGGQDEQRVHHGPRAYRTGRAGPGWAGRPRSGSRSRRPGSGSASRARDARRGARLGGRAS